MANVKSAGVREIILDRCLRKRRGYTVNELLDKVNKELEFNGLSPVHTVSPCAFSQVFKKNEKDLAISS